MNTVNELPVDVAHLNLVCNNDMYDREFILSIYLRETKKELERLNTAIEAGDSKEVYRLSHGCAAFERFLWDDGHGVAAAGFGARRAGRFAKRARPFSKKLEQQFQRIQTFAVLTLNHRRRTIQSRLTRHPRMFPGDGLELILSLIKHV